MALAPLTIFPQSITSGDTTRLLLNFSLCPATTFTSVLVLNRAGVAPVTSTGTASGSSFAFVITATQSAAMTAGQWTYAARCTEIASGDVTSGADGDFTVLANYATTITASATQLQLDAANTALLTLLANPEVSVSFNGQSFTKENQAVLLNTIRNLEAKLAAEKAAAAGLRGDAPTRSIRPYFT